MSNQNKIFTTNNQRLDALVYTLPVEPDATPKLYSTLEGLPLGTSDNSESGELGLKVIVVGQRLSTVENGIVSNGPASSAVPVVPDDSNNLPHASRGLLINDAGDISITDLDGNDTLIEDVVAGSILPIQVVKVWVTGTTCTKIYALY